MRNIKTEGPVLIAESDRGNRLNLFQSDNNTIVYLTIYQSYGEIPELVLEVLL